MKCPPRPQRHHAGSSDAPGHRRHAPDLMVKSGVVYALDTDHLGSVRMVVNVDTDVVAQRISYDAWGNALYEVGTWDVQPFGFAGGLYDPLTKLVHFGAREYDAVTGRWTRADPILFAGGDANLYAYAGNDPVNAVDPSGLRTLSQAEVQGILDGYAAELSHSRFPGWPMLVHHHGGGELTTSTVQRFR